VPEGEKEKRMKATEETDKGGETAAQQNRTRRVSYPGSGFSFTLTRCGDTKELRNLVARRCGRAKGQWIRDRDGKGTPQAFCYVSMSQTLPGVIREASPRGALVEISLFVTRGDRERMLWYHECGHAAHHACLAFPWVAGVEGRGVTDDQCAELLACVNELLCGEVDAITGRADKDGPPESGIPYVLPWSPDYDADLAGGGGE